MYYVMWISERDSDPNTIGGDVAAESGDKDVAIATAKRLTAAGRPCLVENEHYDPVWYPGDELLERD